MVVAVNFCFLDKGEGGGGTNYSSRDCSREVRGEPRSRGGEGPRGRGGEAPSIGVSAAITGTRKIVLLILLPRLWMQVRVYPAIYS